MNKEKNKTALASIKVVGVGGGGGNAISRMCMDFVKGVEFIAINTDAQDLDSCDVRKRIYIGKNLTRGLGTGMNPEIGRQAAEENRSEIAESLKASDLVFITAGLGGGTGSGASPVVAEVAHEAGALTIGVVTKPFLFEGSQRMKVAQDALAKLREKVDALIVVPNDRIFSLIQKDTPILKAFAAIDDILRNSVSGIAELIAISGLINIDFADIRSIMQDVGTALVGEGIASGQERAVNAVSQALNSPLLEVSVEGAKGVLYGVAARDLRMTEFNNIAKMISEAVDPAAKIICGIYNDRKLKKGQLKVVIIATGFNGANAVPRNGQLLTNLFGSTTYPSHTTPERNEKNDKSDDVMAKNETEKSKASYSKGHVDINADEKTWEIPAFLRKKRK